MFARVVTVQLKPHSQQEASYFFKESVGSALREQTGFHSTRFLVDKSSQKCLMVTLWESEADMKASETSGFLAEQLGQLSAFFTGPPNVDRYEILVQLMAK